MLMGAVDLSLECVHLDAAYLVLYEIGFVEYEGPVLVAGRQEPPDEPEAQDEAEDLCVEYDGGRVREDFRDDESKVYEEDEQADLIF